MKICILDYAGHAFTVELGRQLARRGYETKYLYFGQAETPKGRTSRGCEDPDFFSSKPVSLNGRFTKHMYVRRWWQEQRLARAFAASVAAFDPDVTLIANAPLDILRYVQKQVQRRNRAFVFWQQDVYCVALETILGRRYGSLGRLVSRYYAHLEGVALRASQHVVVISPAFGALDRQRFKVKSEQITVIPNWASPETIVPRPQVNPWSISAGLDGKRLVMYSGTLGHKHNPAILLMLAERLRAHTDAAVVVVSEGPGQQWLREETAKRGCGNVHFFPFQPPEVLSDLLGSSRLLVAILEEDAGAFSVPSKILSYLCAGRPIVLSAPLSNLAAETVRAAGAGFVHAPDDHEGFNSSVARILDDDAVAARMGENGRRYAEKTFAVAEIADRFIQVLHKAQARGQARLS